MDTNNIKKDFTWAGFSYFMFVVVEIGSALLISFILKKMGIHHANSWITYIVGLAPIWVFGFPVCYLMLRRLPSNRPADENMHPKYLVQFYLMMTFMMIGGSIIGNILAYIIKITTGIIVNNDTIELISKQDIIPSFIFAVLIGPVLEELAFRKVLLDRLSCYSKKYTIILSGVMFGLFHTNLFQFFYACFIGIVFAYIYTITGKIRYTIILHMSVNFLHGIVPMMIMKNLDLEKIQSLSGQSTTDPAVMSEMMKLYSNPYFLLLIGYYLLIFAFIIAGIILFIINHKRIKVNDSLSPLQKPEAAPTVFLNIGMILFFVITMGYSIYEIIRMK